MDKALTWLASSPLASAAKVGLSAALVWLLDNYTTLNLPPVLQIAVVAALPVVINALNPADARYGLGAAIK